MKCPLCGGKVSKGTLLLRAVMLIILILIIVSIVFGVFKVFKSSTNIDIDILGSSIKNIAELATIEYDYTDAGVFSDDIKFKNQSVPFTEKSFIVKWSGKIKAGVNADDIEIKNNPITQTLKVKIPEAKILSNEIDNDSLEILDEKKNIFNQFEMKDYNDFTAESKKGTEEKAIEGGLLDKAHENAETVISNMLNSIPYIAKNYKVVFED